MLFARGQHHLRFVSGFPYAPLEAMITKISKGSRIQDSFQITPKIESLVVCAIPDIPRKIQKDLSITFWVILLTHRQTNKRTKSGKNVTSLAEVMNKHRNSETTDLQWTVIGPSWPNCSLVLWTWPMKSMKPSPDLGTPCSGQSVKWNWRIVRDWPSCIHDPIRYTVCTGKLTGKL